MIHVLSGSDRVKIQEVVGKILGDDYEVFEGSELGLQELMNIFQGATLFSAGARKILIKDLTVSGRGEGNNIDYYSELLNYADTPHTIVIWESTLSRKKSYKDFVKNKNVQAKKYDLVKSVDSGMVFEVFNTAKRNGPQAVKMVEKIKQDNDPYMFFGLIVSQVLKDFSMRRGQGRREKLVLKELSELDIKMKTTATDPWVLISAFLLRVSTL